MPVSSSIVPGAADVNKGPHEGRPRLPSEMNSTPGPPADETASSRSLTTRVPAGVLIVRGAGPGSDDSPTGSSSATQLVTTAPKDTSAVGRT